MSHLSACQSAYTRVLNAFAWGRNRGERLCSPAGDTDHRVTSRSIAVSSPPRVLPRVPPSCTRSCTSVLPGRLRRSPCRTTGSLAAGRVRTYASRRPIRIRSSCQRHDVDDRARIAGRGRAAVVARPELARHPRFKANRLVRRDMRHAAPTGVRFLLYLLCGQGLSAACWSGGRQSIGRVPRGPLAH